MSVILVSAGYDHTIRFWDALTGVCSKTIQHSDSQINRLELTSDRKYLAAAGNHNVRLYDIENFLNDSHSSKKTSSDTKKKSDTIHNDNRSLFLSFEGHTNNVTSLSFQNENKWMATSSEDGTVKVWSMQRPNVQRNFIHNSPVNQVLIHPNQGELISCDQDGHIKFWNLAENKCTNTIIPEDEVSINTLTISNNGTILVAGNNLGNCYVWKAEYNFDFSETPTLKFKAHSGYITKILLLKDMKLLALCSSDKTAKIWSTENYELETCLSDHQGWVWDCVFSLDSAYLVTACSDHYLRLWDLSSHEIVKQYNGHHKGVVCVALNDSQ